MAANRVGRIQRQIKRAFIAAEGRPLLTIGLLERGYPRVAHYELWHYTSIYRAASKFAVRVGGPGRAFDIERCSKGCRGAQALPVGL